MRANEQVASSRRYLKKVSLKNREILYFGRFLLYLLLQNHKIIFVSTKFWNESGVEYHYLADVHAMFKNYTCF